MPPPTPSRSISRPAAASQKPTSPPPLTVTVRAGETLYSIADQYNVTVQAIIQANRLASKQIYIGQKLILPEGAPAHPAPAAAFDRRVFNRKTPSLPSPAEGAVRPTSESKPARHPEADPGPRQQGRLDLDLGTAPLAKPVSPPKPTASPSPEARAESEETPPGQQKARTAPKTGPEPPKPAFKITPQRSPGQKRPQQPPAAPIPRPKLAPKPRPVTPTLRRPAAKPAPPSPPEWDSATRPEISARSGERTIHEPGAETGRESAPEPTFAPPPAAPPQDRLSTARPLSPPKPRLRHFSAEAIQGLYMPYHTLGSRNDRARMLDFIKQSRINALIIDLKNDGGYLSYRSQVPLAASLGANRLLVENIAQTLAEFRARGVYTIARLVTFKDNLLARAYPDLAAKQPQTGEVWLDQQRFAWGDPFRREVWDYILQLAAEAADLGFAEIQFDALRFPAAGPNGNAQFSQTLNGEARLSAISGFLSAARGILAPTGVKIAANILGYACWRQDDALVGHNIEWLAPYLDVLSPFLYPSAFPSGIPGCANPLGNPTEVVYQGSKRAVERVRACAPHCQVRPWLQDFQDYAFDERTLNVADIQSQITGAVEGGAAGFMAWNPQSDYTQEAYTTS